MSSTRTRIELSKIGKRKCCYCKQILDLSETNFCKRHSKFDFSSQNSHAGCRKCSRGGNPMRGKFIKLKNFMCEVCGISNKNSSFFDIDHIETIKKVGNQRKKYLTKSEFNNSKALCPNCHRLKTLEDGSWKI